MSKPKVLLTYVRKSGGFPMSREYEGGHCCPIELAKRFEIEEDVSVLTIQTTSQDGEQRRYRRAVFV